MSPSRLRQVHTAVPLAVVFWGTGGSFYCCLCLVQTAADTLDYILYDQLFFASVRTRVLVAFLDPEEDRSIDVCAWYDTNSTIQIIFNLFNDQFIFLVP